MALHYIVTTFGPYVIPNLRWLEVLEKAVEDKTNRDCRTRSKNRQVMPRDRDSGSRVRRRNLVNSRTRRERDLPGSSRRIGRRCDRDRRQPASRSVGRRDQESRRRTRRQHQGRGPAPQSNRGPIAMPATGTGRSREPRAGPSRGASQGQPATGRATRKRKLDVHTTEPTATAPETRARKKRRIDGHTAQAQ
ncbi:hypothetical protein ElyMa_005532800 [Elysia marginata]|uniref:Uncharacterized protein n=1 Tax=Elysia marginata TaxID=1093978 RepID=A0AAV4EZE1_9GAST|nr:hypothetical protein ElyMa_005532800 [Elysia marginata]